MQECWTWLGVVMLDVAGCRSSDVACCRSVGRGSGVDVAVCRSVGRGRGVDVAGCRSCS